MGVCVREKERERECVCVCVGLCACVQKMPTRFQEPTCSRKKTFCYCKHCDQIILLRGAYALRENIHKLPSAGERL